MRLISITKDDNSAQSADSGGRESPRLREHGHIIKWSPPSPLHWLLIKTQVQRSNCAQGRAQDKERGRKHQLNSCNMPSLTCSPHIVGHSWGTARQWTWSQLKKETPPLPGRERLLCGRESAREKRSDMSSRYCSFFPLSSEAETTTAGNKESVLLDNEEKEEKGLASQHLRALWDVSQERQALHRVYISSSLILITSLWSVWAKTLYLHLADVFFQNDLQSFLLWGWWLPCKVVTKDTFW